ncbi:hypothetical protein N7517_011655 [Penicillium concentricum]|uniref:MalT-like TPR region domain-containing protein n=1 Tax=Penicillium concentricum TaxID=293559 RepID=A0A9W9RBB9_9EURO|nr:uncharacterized protein N7517_011655 [Penicillium concentricum]KAJ5357046.1 hypothetical protein N7517_011655 [Penicillium concentricum]
MENNERTMGVEHPSTVESMNRLVSTYWHRNQLQEAGKLLDQVLVRDAKLGENHPYAWTNMSNMAQGSWVEALKLDLKFLRVLPPTHNSLLHWKMRLTSTYRDQGKLEPAEQLGLEVVTTCQASLGTNHPVRLTSLENLTSTYRNQGRLSDAEDLGKEAVRICEIVHGETHVETLIDQGHLEEAMDLGENALRRMEASLDRHMGVPMADLAVTYHMLQLLPDAEALTSRALHLMEETLGEDDPHTIYAMANLSIICKSQNKLDAAKDLQRRCTPAEKGFLRRIILKPLQRWGI